ncbi:MAG: arylsulfatase [Planctomycetes bacterium]|nr:arylsulfatase [Planctomycetota bacterium]
MAQQQPGKPNVVLVITDDQGYGDLTCHGNSIIRTPNLDRLHSESVRFTDFHVDPLCAPTRAALMTGHYATRTGIWGTTWGRSLLRSDEVTLADVFAASGYRTGVFGKWHLGDNYPYRPQDRGFQEVLIHGGGGLGQIPDAWGNNYFDDIYCHNGVPKQFSGYCTDIWFEHAMKFIESSRDEPFFCYLPTNAPHAPYIVGEEYAAPYRDKENVVSPEFYGMIANIDENMARLRRHLKELDLEDNTILIFMADNGTSAGAQTDGKGLVTRGFNAGMRGKKGSAYDGGHRDPFFLRWPAGGLGGGRDIDRLTAHIDVLPTLIDLCGLTPPEGVEFDGISLAPLLRGQVESWPDRSIVVQQQQSCDPPTMWRAAVMSDNLRLVNRDELYDIATDPGQQTNIAGDRPDDVERLRDAYEAWWRSVSTQFDDCCRIALGNNAENPVHLTGFDWHAFPSPWNQSHVCEGAELNGFWAVEIERDGEYEFALRRWPQEVDRPINGAPSGCTPIRANRARLKIGDADLTQPIDKSASAATFHLRLSSEKARLQTWLDGDNGSSRGAYYVYVKRL